MPRLFLSRNIEDEHAPAGGSGPKLRGDALPTDGIIINKYYNILVVV
jgi:hypothetical protein